MSQFWHSFRNIRGFHSYRELLFVLFVVVFVGKNFALKNPNRETLRNLRRVSRERYLNYSTTMVNVKVRE